MLAQLIEFFEWLLGWLRRGRKKLPKPDLEVIVMAGNVNLSWKIPTERGPGEPLAISELKHLTVESKLKAAGDDKYVKIGDFLPTVTSRRLVDVPSGTYQIRATWIGTVVGDNSPPKVIEFVVPKSGLPAPDITALLE